MTVDDLMQQSKETERLIAVYPFIDQLIRRGSEFLFRCYSDPVPSDRRGRLP
jgi:hypothetical protein